MAALHYKGPGSVLSNPTRKGIKYETIFTHNFSSRPKYNTHKPDFLPLLGWTFRVGNVFLQRYDKCHWAVGEVETIQNLAPKFSKLEGPTGSALALASPARLTQ